MNIDILEEPVDHRVIFAKPKKSIEILSFYISIILEQGIRIYKFYITSVPPEAQYE